MPCFKPIPAYRSRSGAGIGFKHTDDVDEIRLPCGQCIGCRLEKSRQWAVRMMHEAQMHKDNSFLTLTYAPEFYPEDLSVNVVHFQDFMKRFRARISPRRVRYFHCGEYGEKFNRAHYHAIIFGWGFPDKDFFKEVNGQRYFTSRFLDDLWGRGFCLLGDVEFESCAYVARYVCKKVNGERAHDHYMTLDERTGEVRPVTPEYATMSRRPGIGAAWFDKFGDEVIKSDSVVINGKEMKPPRFYEARYDELDLEAVKGLRNDEAYKRDFDNTPDRLRVREVCKTAQVGFLKRGFEHEN